MAHLVSGLLLCLLAIPTSQHGGNRTWCGNNGKNGNNTAVPKTFKGSVCKLNHIRRLYDGPHPDPDTQLHVDLDGPVTDYSTGVLSTRVIPFSYILTILIGIPSNAYILAFLRVKLQSKSLPSVVLYLNLAFSDLLLVLSLALRVHYHLNANNWIFGEISCRLITALFYGNVYGSAQTIACISLKRYLAVVKPFLYRRMPKTMLAVWMCLVVWFLFGAAVVPELLVRQSYHVAQLNITMCHDVLPLEDNSHSPLVPYRLVMVFLGFLLPFSICIFTHTAVVYHLGQSASDWRAFIRASTLVFTIFVMCFLPSGILHIAHYIRLFSNGDDRLYGYYRLAVCLCCFHSCLDPFLSMLLSKSADSEIQFISLHRTPQRPAIRI